MPRRWHGRFAVAFAPPNNIVKHPVGMYRCARVGNFVPLIPLIPQTSAADDDGNRHDETFATPECGKDNRGDRSQTIPSGIHKVPIS